MKTKERLIGLDVVRCVACFFIIGVHFFLHNGFYYEKQEGMWMFVADVVRWLTFSCVPMFVILTGYLKAEAKFSAKFYKGIIPILVTWIVVSIICIMFKKFYLGRENTWISLFVDFISYKGADYAWYIELYIGLFLLIPFLNQFFCWEKDIKYHIALVVTMCFTAFIPSLTDGMKIGGTVVNVLPNYFVSMWPFAYYFIGCFLRKYSVSISGWVCFLCALMFSVLKGYMSYISAAGDTFYKGIGGGYSDFFVALITVLVFMAFYRIEIKAKWLGNVFAHVSQRSLHIYLLSSIPDALMNKRLALYNSPKLYGWTFPIRCVAVFGMALMLSEIVYPVTTWVSKKIVRLFEGE